jgi:hypothetical protein
VPGCTVAPPSSSHPVAASPPLLPAHRAITASPPPRGPWSACIRVVPSAAVRARPPPFSTSSKQCRLPSSAAFSSTASDVLHARPCCSHADLPAAAAPRVTSLHTIDLHAVALHARAAAPPLPAAGPACCVVAAHALLYSAAACSGKGGPGRRWPRAPRRSFTCARQLRTASPAPARLPPEQRSAPARLPPALRSCAARAPAHVASAASLLARSRRACCSTRARAYAPAPPAPPGAAPSHPAPRSPSACAA